jgi:nitrogen fixation NifU-like protein
MSDMLRELYQEVIIDHSRRPRNFHVLDHASHHADGYNPLCGDKLSLYLQVDNNNIIQDIAFQGQGCAISTASASLLTEILRGKSIAEAEKLFEEFHCAVTKENYHSTKLGKLDVLVGVKEFPARVKCATLAWHTLHAALTQSVSTATTE